LKILREVLPVFLKKDGRIKPLEFSKKGTIPWTGRTSMKLLGAYLGTKRKDGKGREKIF
jgi:hypothetical protein